MGDMETGERTKELSGGVVQPRNRPPYPMALFLTKEGGMNQLCKTCIYYTKQRHYGKAIDLLFHDEHGCDVLWYGTQENRGRDINGVWSYERCRQLCYRLDSKQNIHTKNYYRRKVGLPEVLNV